MPDNVSLNENGTPEKVLGQRGLSILAGLAAIGVLSTNIILPSLRSISEEMNVPMRDGGLLLSSFFVVFAMGQLVVGPLADRYGRKWMVLGGLALFALGSFIAALAHSLPMMIFGRMVQAAGVCAPAVLSRAIARDLLEGPGLARALSLIMVSMAAAPGFSPLLGGFIDRYLHWRADFLIVALLGVVLGMLYAMHLGETLPAHRRVAASLANIPRRYIGLATDVRFILPAAAVSLVIGGLYAFFAATPTILMAGIGLNATTLGLFFTGTVLVVFASGIAAPHLAKRWGGYRVGLTGIALAFAGGVSLLVIEPVLAHFTVAIAIFLLGMGLINPLGTAMALQAFAQQAGVASALLGFLQMSCAALLTALAALLQLNPVTSLGLMLTVVSALALATFVAHGRLTKQ